MGGVDARSMEEQVREAVRDVLAEADLDDLTTRKVRDRVQQRLGKPITEYKKLIAEEINSFLLSHQQAAAEPAAIQTSPPVAQPVQAEPVAVAEPKPASPPKERVPKTKADVRSFISGDAVLQPKKRRKKEPPEPVVQKVVVTPVAEDSDEDDESEEEEEFTVERIYAQRQMEGIRKYLIKWENYAEAESTWEPEENLSCPDLLKVFTDRLPDQIAVAAKEQELVAQLGGEGWTGYQQYKTCSDDIRRSFALIQKALKAQEKRAPSKVLKSSSVLRDLHGSIQRHSSSSLKSLRNTLGMGVTVTETNKVIDLSLRNANDTKFDGLKERTNSFS